MRLKHLRTGILSLLVIMVLVFLFLFYYAQRTRRDAEDFIRDLRVMNVGQAPFQEVASLRHRYSSYIQNKPEACSSEDCKFAIAFENRSALLTLRESSIGASITFRKGSLQEVYVQATCAGADRKPPFVPTFVVIVTQAMFLPPGLHGGTVSSGNGYSFNIGPGATPEQLAKLYGFKLDFLDRLGGCHNATEMFAESPSSWPQSWWAR